jgi:phosphoribosylformimino-5-aminoimidazole carboxamide ribotide isomerase
MKIFPAIDIKDGSCVRLVKGEYATAHKVAEDPLETARAFEAAGAEWVHMVDLDGAKDAALVNKDIFTGVAKETGLKVEVGGGIRTMDAVDYYLSHGITRVILGSAAVKNPAFAREAVIKYGERIVIGIDARDGMVAAEGWLDTSDVYFTDLAVEMEKIGVKTIIFTDISRDGTLSGPNLAQLIELSAATSCDIVASGGVSGIKDIIALRDAGLYGAIAGKAIYTGNLDVAEALREGEKPRDLSRYFAKSELIPAIIQEASTGEVLMLAYMNEQSLRLTLETGRTWFWSRSRNELWNKGATSGHYQKIISINGDCDDDTLLIRVEQTGAACHTGNHSCFFQPIGFRKFKDK